MKTTLVHELTHIWQYTMWPQEDVDKFYPDRTRYLLAHEGMAVWTEVQYLMAMGEVERAISLKRSREVDESEYGVGMLLYLAKYRIRDSRSFNPGKTPFRRFPPILF